MRTSGTSAIISGRYDLDPNIKLDIINVDNEMRSFSVFVALCPLQVSKKYSSAVKNPELH